MLATIPAAAILTASMILAMILVVVALRVRVKSELVCQQVFDSLIRVAAYTGV